MRCHHRIIIRVSVAHVQHRSHTCASFHPDVQGSVTSCIVARIHSMLGFSFRVHRRSLRCQEVRFSCFESAVLPVSHPVSSRFLARFVVWCLLFVRVFLLRSSKGRCFILFPSSYVCRCACVHAHFFFSLFPCLFYVHLFVHVPPLPLLVQPTRVPRT